MSNCSIRDGKYFAPNGEESKLHKDLSDKMSLEEANSMFILSKTPTFIKEVIQPLIKSHTNKIPNPPENVSFKETFVKGMRTFHIYEGKQKVGRIQLAPHKEGFKVKSSLINENKRGKGYGKHLYYHAISKLISENNTLYTDTNRTEDADNIWKSLERAGLTQDKKTVKPLPASFDQNGEILMEVLVDYAANKFSTSMPLSSIEKSHLINLQMPGVETSDDLYKVLYNTFFKDGLFNPDVNKMKKLYSADEISLIISDPEVLGRIKETIEKLRNTEDFDIPQVPYKKEFDFKSLKLNILGQFKKENPLKLEKESKEDSMNKIPVIDETGRVKKTKLIFEKALKIPTQELMRAIRAVVNAHPMVDTSNIEQKLIRSLKNFGLSIDNLTRDNFSTLLNYFETPSTRNREALEDALGFERVDETKAVDLPNNRTYQYLKTNMSEQEVFDELSLIKTSTPNVYHKVNKIEESQMREIQKNKDLSVPEYQLYKDYYGYENTSSKVVAQSNIETSLTYLKGDFVADFAVDKIKNPTEFNKQFRITDHGIELISDDIITMETIKAYIKDGAKYSKEMADYSLLNKDIPNLKEPQEYTVKTITERRIEVVNNIDLATKPTTSIEIVDDESIFAPDETSKFLRVADELYEQQEKGYYSKIEVNQNIDYNEMNPRPPVTKDFDLVQKRDSKIKTKNIIDNQTDEEHFSCV